MSMQGVLSSVGKPRDLHLPVRIREQIYIPEIFYSNAKGARLR